MTKTIKILAFGHNAKKIRFLGKVDNATIMKLFFAIRVLAFAKFMGDGNGLGEAGG